MGGCSKTGPTRRSTALIFRASAAVLILIVASVTDLRFAVAAETSEFSDEPIPMVSEDELPARTPPLIEIGPDFLGSGNIPEGIELPTGAVWTPALWVFGNARTAVQYFDNGPGEEQQEWVNRLDLFANLHLTPTERILFGVSPLRDEGEFTGCQRKPDAPDCFSSFNFDVTTFFAEGEFGEIFPNLDPSDSKSLDIGFSVGRQQLFFQEGMLVNDTVDGLGLTRDNIILPGIVDVRVTGFWGWGELNRDDNQDDEDAQLFGLFTEADFRRATVNFDAAYVTSEDDDGVGGDGLNLGASSVQRFGLYNTAFRVNHSVALDNADVEIDDGTLIFAETSTTLPYGTDIVYGNAFWGIDNFSSAARDPTVGGPLGRVGILFAAVGLGDYGAALGNRADDSYGAAIGYQQFFNNERTQLILEAGGRNETNGPESSAVAAGFRLQHAIGARTLLQLDGFVAANQDRSNGAGLRTELLVRF